MTAALFVVALACAEPPKELDIRDHEGKVVIAADRIVAYDWETHTLTLKPGTVEAVQKDVFGPNRRTTFAVAVGGKTVYRGTWKSPVMSDSASTPVILLSPAFLKLGRDQLRIDLGYPTRDFFRGDDPRGSPEVKAATEGKRAGTVVLMTPNGSRVLTEKESAAYKTTAEWLGERMNEVRAVKPGTTYADLTKAFEEDGGLSALTGPRRFVSVLCPYLKIDVEFEADANLPTPKDAKIKRVSKPYFEPKFTD